MVANLIPIHLDKNSGELVAKDFGTEFTTGFLFTQNIASLTWVIPHNSNTTNYILQVYDTSGNLIIPNEVVATDINTVTVSFLVAQAGKATIVLFINL